MKSNNNYTRIDDIVKSVIEKINEAEEGVSIQIKQRETSVDKNFEITHREYVARVCEAGGDPYGKVKAHIVRNTRLDCGLYFGSFSQTCEATGVSISTVKRVISAMQESDLIRNFMSGVWAVHPKFLRRGKSGKFLGLMRFYYSLPKKATNSSFEKRLKSIN